jgi:hypothetical protein
MRMLDLRTLLTLGFLKADDAFITNGEGFPDKCIRFYVEF